MSEVEDRITIVCRHQASGDILDFLAQYREDWADFVKTAAGKELYDC